MDASTFKFWLIITFSHRFKVVETTFEWKLVEYSFDFVLQIQKTLWRWSDLLQLQTLNVKPMMKLDF